MSHGAALGAAGTARAWETLEVMPAFELPARARSRLIQVRGREHSLVVIQPASCALIIVDMQNHFVAPGAVGEVPAARAVVPAINAAARCLRQAGGTIVWVKTSSAQTLARWSQHHLHNLNADFAHQRLASLALNSTGFELFPAMDVHVEDLQVTKTHYSAFIPGSSTLHTQLLAREVTTLLVCGTATNVCCDSSARDAMMMGYRVAMLSDGCASWSQAEHESALTSFALFFGDVMSVKLATSRLTTSALRLP